MEEKITSSGIEKIPLFLARKEMKMKLIAPDYYTQFTCIADRCQHSCCIGWEIDIDEDTYETYRAVTGPFGDRLREHITEQDGQACFCLSEEERCPFLNCDGLCDIILNLGEDYLSQICTDHPRFCSFYGDRTEIGLGLCCEEAVRILLSQEKKTEWMVLEDDGEVEIPSKEELSFFDFRSKLVSLAQNRKYTLEKRMSELLNTVGVREKEATFSQQIDFILSLERMDDAWTALLSSKQSSPDGEFFLKNDVPAEQLLVYFLFRHCSDMESIASSVAFSVFSVRFLRSLCENHHADSARTAEIVRLYSSEIEYSEENTLLLREYAIS